MCEGEVTLVVGAYDATVACLSFTAEKVASAKKICGFRSNHKTCNSGIAERVSLQRPFGVSSDSCDPRPVAGDGEHRRDNQV